MTIEKNPVNGSIEISDIVNNYLMRRVYYGHTEIEAKRLFMQEVKRESK